MVVNDGLKWVASRAIELMSELDTNGYAKRIRSERLMGDD